MAGVDAVEEATAVARRRVGEYYFGMRRTDRFTITSPFENPKDRMTLFFQHYDLRVYFSDGEWFDLGAGSFPITDRVWLVRLTPGRVGSLGSIGRWCQAALSCEIMSSGAHDHDQPVNISFQMLRTFGRLTEDLGMKPVGPMSIGNGVVISSGARIMPGVAIGDGAVVGALAKVTRDVEPLTIVAGDPAVPIRKRQPFVPWWDFTMSYLIANAGSIQDVAASPGPHEFRPERPRFALRKTGDQYKLIGFIADDALRPITEAPAAVQAYVAQALDPAVLTPYWLADCWAE